MRYKLMPQPLDLIIPKGYLSMCYPCCFHVRSKVSCIIPDKLHDNHKYCYSFELGIPHIWRKITIELSSNIKTI